MSVQPKPAPDHGYAMAVDENSKPWQASPAPEAPAARGRALSAPVGLEKPRPSPNGLRRASSNAGAGKNWTKAKYAVKGASAFGAAGAALAGRRAEARDGSRNGWIASSCHLGPASHRKLESFELVRVVGRGVMGEVTLAKFRKDGKFVALKAVSKGYVAKHNDERHVQNERAILTRLRHPFVVSLFGTFQDKKKVYFVMEFVAGGELFSKLRGNQCLTAPVARFYLAEILSALAYVHANGFAYRDLRVRPRPPFFHVGESPPLLQETGERAPGPRRPLPAHRLWLRVRATGRARRPHAHELRHARVPEPRAAVAEEDGRLHAHRRLVGLRLRRPRAHDGPHALL